MGKVYLIEKAWIDPTENQPGDAFGYAPYGYVTDKAEAARLCRQGGLFTSEDCWAITGAKQKLKYKEVNLFDY